MRTTLSTPTVRPFHVDDVLAVLNRDGAQVPLQQVLEQAASGPAWTAVRHGEPLACGGIVLLWPQVGAAWMIVSDAMLAYPLWFTHTVRGFLHETIARLGLHRVEAVALVDSPINQRFLEALGFTDERHGIARAYLSDRRPVIRYELVKGDD